MRIIAGKFSGRELKAPKGLTTRPTTGRVREALFSIIGDLREARVADFYAGTGAMGLEAISRGAGLAAFVETSKPALIALRQNVERLGAGPQSHIIERPVRDAARLLGALGPFDWILADPPWPEAQRAALDVAKAAQGLLAPTGTVVIGHRASEPVELPPETGLVCVDRRHWGDSGLSFFEPEEPAR